MWDLGLLENNGSFPPCLWGCWPLEENLSHVCLLPAQPIKGLEIVGWLVVGEQSRHCQIFFLSLFLQMPGCFVAQWEILCGGAFAHGNVFSVRFLPLLALENSIIEHWDYMSPLLKS